MNRIKALLAVVVVVIVGQGLEPVSGAIVGLWTELSNDVYTTVSLRYLTNGFLLALPAIIYAHYRASRVDEYADLLDYARVPRTFVTGEEWDDVSYGLLATLLVFLALNIIIVLLGLPVAENNAVSTGAADPFVIPLLVFFTLIIVAPAEEFVYRGIVQRRLEESFHPFVAIGIASMLFGIVHMTAVQGTFTGHVVYVVFIGLVSVVWGYYYYKSKNLWISIIIHALYNCILYLSLVAQIITA